jgi:hypothetical protein
MASTRRILLLAVAAAAAALFVLPAIANANVYCVDVSGGDCTNLEPAGAVQQALDDASAHGGADTVRLGTGTYSPPVPGGFHYSNASDAVSVIGAGQGQTAVTMSTPGAPPGSSTHYFGLEIFGPGSTISDLTVNLPAPVGGGVNQQYYAIDAEGTATVVTHVTVNGPGVTINGSAVFMDNGTFAESTIAMPNAPGGIGLWEVDSSTGNLLAYHDTITAQYAISYSNTSTGSLIVDRSTLHATYVGVDAQASTAAVRDTIIDLGASSSSYGLSAGYSNTFGTHTSSLTADGVTIYGTGSGQVGARAFGYDLNSVPIPGDTATLNLHNSIIDLTGTSPISLQRDADNYGVVNVTSDYSNYSAPTNDSGNPNGSTGQLSETNHTTLSPDLVSPGSNFHLMSSSPMIDAGDPAAPPPAQTDIDGDNREILGKDGCAARRDIGADEFVPGSPPTLLDCTPPDTSFESGPTGTIADNAPTFTFASTESPATFQCKVDGGATLPCTTPFTSVPLGDGPHTLSVQAIDSSLNVDPSAATRSFTVDTTAPETSIGSHPKPKTKSRTGTFAFSSSEPGSSFLCSYDGKAYAPCTSPFKTPKLTKGRHRFDVLSTDAAGNRDQSAATFLWKVTKRHRH